MSRIAASSVGLEPSQRDRVTGDLLDLQRRGVELLGRVHVGELTYDDALFELAGAREAVDAAYLEVPGAIQRAVGGLERMAKIVASMKEFSHPGRSEMSSSDLNRGLLSTLVITRNEYKDFAEVETDLGELPQVMCHIGELNQVFLNLIVNAAHAIEDVAKKTGRRGEIRVRTWVDGSEVLVSISDTGGGIPAAVREHIFEPFFTTKEIGRGTGQGLAIARTIVVENHRGRLLVESIAGTGTTFTIALPIEGHQLVAGAAVPPAGVVAASPRP
jgi:two-component system NtrC family sensor kinase